MPTLYSYLHSPRQATIQFCDLNIKDLKALSVCLQVIRPRVQNTVRVLLAIRLQPCFVEFGDVEGCEKRMS